MLARETLITVLSFQFSVRAVDLRRVQIDPEAVALVPAEYARQHSVLPTGFDANGSRRIATRVPNDIRLSSQLSTITGRQAKLVLAIGGILEDLIHRAYQAAPAQGTGTHPPTHDGGDTGHTVDGGDDVWAIAPITSGAPAALISRDFGRLPGTQALDMVISQAVQANASSIHLVPGDGAAKVLFRVDGQLREVVALPLTLHENMVSEVKARAGMDISDDRRPQDGGVSTNVGELRVELRVATIGAYRGEMMVIRVLDPSSGVIPLGDLGMDAEALQVWRSLLDRPQGMLLVSGPAGSGKTTTLYASATELSAAAGNIRSIEDPIWYCIDGVNQIQVDRAAGIDFSVGPRSIMSLDPDIILVGDIRDAETATAAVDEALTGLLVLAAIQSDDAASAISRLVELGVEPLLAAEIVISSLAQRLVRLVCSRCGEPSEPPEDVAAEAMVDEREMDEPPQFRSGRGCGFCGDSVFVGRSGVFEVLPVDAIVRKQIVRGAFGPKLRDTAVKNGMVTVRRSGIEMARAGKTTLSEVFRSIAIRD